MMLASFQKYDISFVEQLLRLNQKQKEFFCLAAIERQKYLVKMFDERYNEALVVFFDYALATGYEVLLTNKIKELDTLIDEIESHIPDTEDYGESEGAYAQNAIISIFYFFQFIVTKKNEYFSYVIEKVLESIYTINYEKNENYNEELVVNQEIGIYKVLIQILQKNSLDEILVSKTREWSVTFVIPHSP